MIKSLITKYGIDKLRFWYEPKAKTGSFVMSRIDEDRYKVANGYKIELRVCGGSYKDSFYISDLESLIKEGIVKVFYTDYFDAVGYFQTAEF